jgi:hypothetical protein
MSNVSFDKLQASHALILKEIVMKTLVVLAACMFGFAGACHAAQIASSALAAGPSQTVALCLVYNGGTTPQTVRVQLFDEAGTVLADSGTCQAIPGGQFCSIAKSGISNDNAYACSATAASVTQLRGAIILQDNSHHSLRSAELR